MGALPPLAPSNVVQLPPHLAHLQSQQQHHQQLAQHLAPPPNGPTNQVQSLAAVAAQQQAAAQQQSSLRATPSPSAASATQGRLTPTSVAALLHHQQYQYSHPPPSFGPPPNLGLPMHGSAASPQANHMSLLQQSAAVAGVAGQQQQQQQQQQQGRNPLFSRDRKLESILNLNAFDPSEFPSLGQNAAPNPSLSARPNYGKTSDTLSPYSKMSLSSMVGMVKQPAMESSEFNMSNEDFPALPGALPGAPQQAVPSGDGIVHHVSNGGPPVIPGIGQSRYTNQGILQTEGGMGVGNAVSHAVAQEERAGANLGLVGLPKKGIQTSPQGAVKNIPNSMVTDQFGMIGLLTFIRAAETDPNLVSLALGADLTTLGLNLNSETNLYPTFGGPWADTPCRPQDIDYHVPHEYLTNQAIRDKLAPVKLNRYNDDVLFYMFYTNVGDVLQLAAAAELYNRDWRYHRDDRIWITRAPGMAPSEQTNTYERGTYYFFDVNSWRKVSKDFHLDYDKLEDRPSLPQNLVSGAGGGQTGGQTAASMASPGIAPASDRPGPASPSMSF